MTLGGVYFIQEGTDGPVKIGWSANVCSRRDTMQTGNSQPLNILGVLESAPKSVETEWHVRFRDLHLRAEWFLPARPLLNAICESAVSPAQTRRRSHAPAGMAIMPYAKRVGVHLLNEWLATSGMDCSAFAKKLGYDSSYLADLLIGRQPLGRSSAKRIYDVVGDDLHPAKLLADMTDRRHIELFLMRLPAVAA